MPSDRSEAIRSLTQARELRSDAERFVGRQRDGHERFRPCRNGCVGHASHPARRSRDLAALDREERLAGAAIEDETGIPSGRLRERWNIAAARCIGKSTG